MSELKYRVNIQRDESDPDIWFPMKGFCQPLSAMWPWEQDSGRQTEETFIRLYEGPSVFFGQN